MSLKDQIAELLDDRNNPDFRRGVLAMKALLPSLPGWGKEKKCSACSGIGYSSWKDPAKGFIPCDSCHGTGTIRSPLEFSDVDWNRVLEYAILWQDVINEGPALTTKSGEKIVRREK